MHDSALKYRQRFALFGNIHNSDVSTHIIHCCLIEYYGNERIGLVSTFKQYSTTI